MINESLLSNQGFTLTELLIAGALTGGVFLIAGTGVVFFGQGSAQLARSSTKMTSASSFASQFTTLMESAHVAVQFEHLPIPVVADCATITADSPAVRRKVNGLFQCVDSTDANIAQLIAGGISDVEFFRDSLGTLRNGQVLVNSNLVPAFTGAKLSLPPAVRNGDYYATWPLRLATAPSFLVMRGLNSAVNLSVRYCEPYVSAGQGEPNCGAAVGGGNLRLDSMLPIVLEDLQGHPFLIYNSKDPSQYIVQYVAGGANYPNGALPPGVVSQWDLDLQSLVGSSFSTANRYFAASASIPVAAGNTWMQSHASGWSVGNPGSAIYLFPTEAPSVNVATWPPGANAALNMVSQYNAQYATSLEFRPKLVALPIALTAIYLRQGTLPVGCPAALNPNAGCAAGTTIPPGCPRRCEVLHLVAKNYFSAGGGDGGVEVVLADNIWGPVTIARKLGGSSFQIFVEEN
jgi:hypothetical protein